MTLTRLDYVLLASAVILVVLVGLHAGGMISTDAPDTGGGAAE